MDYHYPALLIISANPAYRQQVCTTFAFSAVKNLIVKIAEVFTKNAKEAFMYF